LKEKSPKVSPSAKKGGKGEQTKSPGYIKEGLKKGETRDIMNQRKGEGGKPSHQ